MNAFVWNNVKWNIVRSSVVTEDKNGKKYKRKTVSSVFVSRAYVDDDVMCRKEKWSELWCVSMWFEPCNEKIFVSILLEIIDTSTFMTHNLWSSLSQSIKKCFIRQDC